MSTTTKAILFAIAVAVGGCYASTGVGYQAAYVGPAPVYTASATTVSVDTYGPDLVDVGGGVQVIADYDEPVFYSDNFYWRFYGGTWYRSNAYNRGWVVYNDVPYSVRRIDRPHAYVHYRPQGWTPRSQRGNNGYREAPRNEPYVRDHRDPYRPAPTPVVRDHREPYQPAPAPVVRDHREPYQQPAPAPVVRDHREPYQQPAPAPAPVTRDHRDNRDNRDDRDKRNAPPIVRDHR
jgi:hypothetical protein